MTLLHFALYRDNTFCTKLQLVHFDFFFHNALAMSTHYVTMQSNRSVPIIDNFLLEAKILDAFAPK